LAIFKNRLVSKQEIYYTFVACSFPVYLWTFYKIFNQIPAWITKLNVGEVASVSAYAVAFSLFESLILCLLFLILAGILPERIFRRKFVAHVMMIMLVSAVWAVIAQFNYSDVYGWTFADLLPWLVIYLFSILLIYFLVQRFERFSRFVYRFVQRISVLATLYILVGVIGLIVVVLRNI
jgi:hypothetical protein